jgi:uncharacterized membrane protein
LFDYFKNGFFFLKLSCLGIFFFINVNQKAIESYTEVFESTPTSTFNGSNKSTTDTQLLNADQARVLRNFENKLLSFVVFAASLVIWLGIAVSIGTAMLAHRLKGPSVVALVSARELLIF